MCHDPYNDSVIKSVQSYLCPGMEVCGTPVWDISVTWNTENPDFTPCFHNTVLVFAPTIFLLLFSPLELYFQASSHNRNIPWCVLNILRLVLTFLLVVVVLAELILNLTTEREVFISDFLAPAVKTFTFSFSIILAVKNVKRGVQSSAIMFSYWSLTALAETLTFASVVRFGDQIGQVSNASVFGVEFGLVLSIWFLHFWADPSPMEKSLKMQSNNPNPGIGASFPNKMTFTWFGSVLRKGWKTPLEQADLYDLKPSEQAEVIHSEWEKHWRKCEEKKLRNRSKDPITIFKPLLFTFGAAYLSSSFIQLITVILTQISPQALNLLIGFVSSGEELWKGYVYMIYLVGVNLVITILTSQYFLEQMTIGLRIRAAITSALFRKSLKLSSKSRKERSVGETVNLMQIDSQRLMDIIQNLNLLWSSPLTVILSIYSLWGLLGPSCLAGLLVMVLLIPSNAVLGSRMKLYQRQNMKFKDKRMKTMNEILDGIKVLKLYAWEPSFQEQVEEIRNLEVSNLKKLSYLQALQTFLFNAAPFFVAIASFGTFVLVDSNNILDAQIAFVSITYFNIIRRPLNQLPGMVVQMIQAQVSWDRLNTFLNSAEINPNNVTHDDEGETVVSVKKGSFTWDPDQEPTLHNVELNVKKGEIVAIVGKVGSGKSSLLSAFTNDMEKSALNAEINIHGKVSYVPQQAWMQNATLQYNVTFGQRYNEKMYHKVLDACALKPDLEILPEGDKTEIGEKGINLSGGQKQRVSLARAVYNNGDVYLLDDPLSAVDAHVGKHLFDKVIGPAGLLKHKTRLLVTHGVKYLPVVDRIVVLKNGKISEVGTYEELLNEGKEFANFLIEYIQEEEEKILDKEDLSTLNIVKEELEKVIGSEKLNSEIKKAKSLKSEYSNISAYKSDTESIRSYITQTSVDRRNRRTIVNNGVGRNRKIKKESTEKTPLNKSLKNTNRNLSYGSNKLRNEKTKSNDHAGRLIQAERVETKAVTSAVYSFYFKAVGLLAVVTIFLFNIITQGFSIGTNVWLSRWSDDPDAAETNTRNLYLSVYGVMGALSAVAIGVSTLITAVGGLSASTILHDKMLAGVFRAPMSFFDTNPKGRIVNRFAKDVDYVDVMIPLTFSNLLRQGFTVLGTIFVICTTSPIFIAVVIPIGFLYWFVQKFYVSTSRQLRRMESSTRSPIYSWFGEAVSGISTVKAYGLQKRFIQEMEEKIDLNSMSMEPNYVANRWLSVRLEMLGNVIIFFAALFAILGRDSLDPGIVGLSLSYAMQVTQSLGMLIRQTSMIETNMVSVERIMEYQSGLPQEAAWELDGDPDAENWPKDGNICLENLEVRYREGLDLVLRGISLDIKGGEKIGIVGRTGSGKSSLTLSLFRINEAAGGALRIDNRDISSVGLGTLRSRLTIIPQDPVLFSGSLRMNLDPFNQSTTEAIWKALELAHLKTFASSLPGGLDHVVTEGGNNLSVGQRQLLCLARAVLRKTKIIVLDEATAAVDLETDDLIQVKTTRRTLSVINYFRQLSGVSSMTAPSSPSPTGSTPSWTAAR